MESVLQNRCPLIHPPPITPFIFPSPLSRGMHMHVNAFSFPFGTSLRLPASIEEKTKQSWCSANKQMWNTMMVFFLLSLFVPLLLSLSLCQLRLSPDRLNISCRREKGLWVNFSGTAVCFYAGIQL